MTTNKTQKPLRAGTAMITTDATAKWGVKYTWPDGRTEVRPVGGRHRAEVEANHRNYTLAQTGNGPTAEAVTR